VLQERVIYEQQEAVSCRRELSVSNRKLCVAGESSQKSVSYKLGLQLTVRTQPLYVVLIYLSE